MSCRFDEENEVNTQNIRLNKSHVNNPSEYTTLQLQSSMSRYRKNGSKMRCGEQVDRI